MKTLRLILICAVALSFVVIARPSHAMTSQAELSSGCTTMNDSLYDNYYGSTNPSGSFNAGETVTLTAGEPGEATSVGLWVGGVLVDTASFPGTVTYTFPANATTDVFWQAMNATWTVECGFTGIPEKTAETPAETSTSTHAPIPGCDLGMPISNTSVMGQFVADTNAHYAPSTQSDTFVATMKAGQTAWVLGMDSAGAYYKIVWDCSLLWVPVSAMGPAYGDALWQGWPLPTQVVK